MDREYNKYLVLKWETIDNCLSKSELEQFDILLDYIYIRLNNNNKYIICNQDEPYADEIWETILEGEDAKAKAKADS